MGSDYVCGVALFRQIVNIIRNDTDIALDVIVEMKPDPIYRDHV